MCLAIPGKVLEIQADGQGVRMGKTNFGGIVKQVCLEYTPDVECGDYVLVHVGFALSKVDAAEAERTYRALEELKQLGELDPPQLPVEVGRSVPDRRPALPEQRHSSSSDIRGAPGRSALPPEQLAPPLESNGGVKPEDPIPKAEVIPKPETRNRI